MSLLSSFSRHQPTNRTDELKADDFKAHACQPAPGPVETPEAQRAEPQPSPEEQRLQRLQDVLDRFEITIAQSHDLAALGDYEIAVIVDDSGSMLQGAAPPHKRSLTGPNPSRWDELKVTLCEIVEIAACLDPRGVDIFFLNRSPVLGVKSATDGDLVKALTAPPRGGTPLTQTLERVAKKTGGEKPVLLLIFTDGEPTGGREPFKALVGRLMSPQAEHMFHMQIVACTADPAEIAWLTDFEKEFAGVVNVTDDFYSQREQVLQSGRVTKFTRADWCLKAMLGPAIPPKHDVWEEEDRAAQCQCTVM